MENNQVQTSDVTISHEIIESLIINGDLSKLNAQQKVEYYKKYCGALGLNPVTQPFSLLTLNGKQKLYCGREGTAQLSKVHGVSHEILTTETVNGIYIVKAKAISGNRFTSSTGAVSIENLKGDALCNAIMKAETKAKRRATLDLLGLGMLDETEIGTIPNATTEDAPHVDVTDETKINTAYNIISASQNEAELKANWKTISKEMQAHPDIVELGKALKDKFAQPTTA